MRRYAAFLVVAILLAVSQQGAVAQELRVWTNSKGKSVKGTMTEKGDDWVKIKIKSKVHKIMLKTLSEKDQEYVKNTKIRKEFSCKVTSASRKAPDTDFDIHTVTFHLEGVEDMEGKVYLGMVWIYSLRLGGFRKQGGSGIKSTVEAFYGKDGDYSHEAGFSRQPGIGEKCRGFAYRILDANGNKLMESAEPSSCLSYLEKANFRHAPEPPEDGNEEEGEDGEQKEGKQGPDRLIPRGRQNR